MGKYRQGIHGDFSGRVGNIVGSSWKGRSVMKIRPARVNNPRTEAQQKNRGRFALMGQFLSTQSRLVKIGWKPAAQNTTAFNEAMRYNLGVAIAGEYPDQFIDFSKVQLSSGQLPVPTNLQAVAASALSFNLSWENNSNLELAGDNDLLMIGIYDAASGEGYTVSGGFTRQQELALVTVPDNWSGRTLEVFVFMVSTLGIGTLNTSEFVSPTVHAGNVVLAD